MMRLIPVALVVMAMIFAAQANAAVLNFNFPITVSQEVPTPTINLSPESLEPAGTGFVTYDTDTNELEWEVNYAGLTGPLVGAHFHGPADFGATAGVQVGISAGGPASGVITGSTTITDVQESDLLDGLWYVNLHTAANPPGEIRGQVIPEPASLALLGLGGLLLARRRR